MVYIDLDVVQTNELTSIECGFHKMSKAVCNSVGSAMKFLGAKGRRRKNYKTHLKKNIAPSILLLGLCCSVGQLPAAREFCLQHLVSDHQCSWLRGMRYSPTVRVKIALDVIFSSTCIFSFQITCR